MTAIAINRIVTPTVMPTIFPVEFDSSDSLLVTDVSIITGVSIVTGVSIITGVDVTATGPGAPIYKLCNYNISYVCN